jgi:hypothetical protein
VKASFFFLLILSFYFQAKAQSLNCTFKKPVITIHFGTGNVRDVNTTIPVNYERVRSYCPTDGHYTYTPYTSDCFSGDWFTLTEDHTAGDASGNMLLVNSSYNAGTFLKTTISGLKGGTTYEFAAWLMNVCKITDKCPFPLLPNITITLQTGEGKTVAKFGIGEVERKHAAQWTQHKGLFITPPSETSLILIMTNSRPGGCGNDFAVDDITVRECIPISIPKPVVKAAPKTTPKTSPPVKKQPVAVKPVQKIPKSTVPAKSQPRVVDIVKPQKDSQVYSPPVIKPKPQRLPPPPPALTRRENTLVKRIEAETGEITIKLYDNGEIDDDTISIYHNNVLLMSHARLSQKAISLSIAIDPSQPHHEFVMVAENLGSIPPNTSLMVITAGTKRYEVFISSTEQRNAKVVLDLKE